MAWSSAIRTRIMCRASGTRQPQAEAALGARRRPRASRARPAARSASPVSPLPVERRGLLAASVVLDLDRRLGSARRARGSSSAVRRCGARRSSLPRARPRRAPTRRPAAAPRAAVELALDARGAQRGARALERIREPLPAVALHRLAHLGERAAGDRLDVLELVRRGRGIALHQPRCELALERDHREAVPEQVVQVARDPQALLGDRELGELLARLLQLAVRGDLAPERRHHRADRRSR